MVNGARLTNTDIAADNGTIHVIDTVIMATDKRARKMNMDKMDDGKMGSMDDGKM